MQDPSFDTMATLSRREDISALIMHCRDPWCGFRTWRDFASFPPSLRLASLRNKARCTTCNGSRGRGIDVELVHRVHSTHRPGPDMIAQAETSLAALKASIAAQPFSWQQRGGLWAYHRPDPRLARRAGPGKPGPATPTD